LYNNIVLLTKKVTYLEHAYMWREEVGGGGGTADGFCLLALERRGKQNVHGDSKENIPGARVHVARGGGWVAVGVSELFHEP